MARKISAVINTFNEAKNIKRAIGSLSFADEVIVCDMYSDDETAKIAKSLGAKVFFHKRTGFVEPARNFAISKASHEWILILDADEEISADLARRLKAFAQKPIESSSVEIPRKNIIFGKWMKASMWWPDYHIRFFKKGEVIWKDAIHSKPEIKGQTLTLPLDETLAIVHYNYESVSQFLLRMDRYTTIQAEELIKTGYKFDWKDLIYRPLGEFLSRYFASKGFLDGLHGLSLSFLQAFSFLILYLKIWEAEKFKEREIKLGELKELSKKASGEINYWFKYGNLSDNVFKRFFQKVKGRV